MNGVPGIATDLTRQTAFIADTLATHRRQPTDA